MGSHENWERETEIKIGVWQAKEKTLPDPPPLHIAAGRVARPIAAPTCTEEGKRAKEREDSGGSGNAANIFGATARTRSSSGCHCHRLRCQRQRRRCYFVSVVSTVDTKSKKHFTTMSILNMATLHCTHMHTSTHARTRTSHPRAALQTMRRRKCEWEGERAAERSERQLWKSLNLHLYFAAAISGVALQLLHILLLLLFLSLFCFLLFFARHTHTHTETHNNCLLLFYGHFCRCRVTAQRCVLKL